MTLHEQIIFWQIVIAILQLGTLLLIALDKRDNHDNK